MSRKPVLVLQPRRLGDLILTFPLLRLLQRSFPQSPLWVMAQRNFYEPLLPFAPPVAFLPPENLPQMRAREYEAVINLGSDAQSADFAGQCQASLKLGRVAQAGVLSVNGYWQLYREGLTQNNRHNIFHWADLFRLDLQAHLPRPTVLSRPANSGRIGLFVGASETAKRPPAQFWAELSNRLAGLSLKPLLLGGPDDVAMGLAIMAKGAKAANFCGKTSLAQLAGLLKTLDLLITPDTGPMHLADLLSVPVLNLSMGNVNAAETGPFSPGQHVLAARMSCSGCWQCQRSRLYCRDAFNGRQIATLAQKLVLNDKDITAPPGLELLTTYRDELGLYQLDGESTARRLLDSFWQAAFLRFNDANQYMLLEGAAQALIRKQAPLARHMRANFGKMLAYLGKTGRSGRNLPDTFWQGQPWHSRLFAGNIQLSLQNSGPSALPEALSRIDVLQAVLADAT